MKQVALIGKFLVSGGVATLVNLGVLYALTEFAGWHYLLSAVVAFAVAFCFSFSLQKFWTFRDRRVEVAHMQASLYLGVSLFGLVLNTGLLFAFVEWFHIWYIAAEVCAAVLVAAGTFFAYKHVIFVERITGGKRFWQEILNNRAAYAGFAAALIIAGFCAAYKLSESPALWYDEGLYSQISARVAETGFQTLQLAPGEFVDSRYMTVGYPLVYPVALSYRLFGIGALQGRAVMALYIVLFVIAAFALIGALFTPRIASLSAFLLASFPMLYGNGKAVIGEVPGLFFLVLSLLSLEFLERSGFRKPLWYAAFGLCAGLCVATKPIYILLLGAFLIAYVFVFKRTRVTWRGLALGALAFGATVAVWAYLQFGAGISIHTVLGFYANPYSVENVQNLIKANLLRFVTESTPIYTLALMLAWSIALWLKRKSDISSAERAAFFFSVLVLLAYLRLPGWYRYLFPALTVALVFLPSSLVAIAEFAKGNMPRLPRWVPFASAAVVVCLLSALQLYQTAYGSYVAGYYSSTTTARLQEALHDLGPSASFYLYNVPQVAILLPSENFYQYLPITEHIVLGSSTLPTLFEGKADYAIVDSDAYKANSSAFLRYHSYETVDRYEILKLIPSGR